MHHNLDKYQLQGELGRGSFGIVYRGFHERLQREVAIKTLVPKLAGNPQLKKRFLLEARVAATLSHDNLAVVYDYGESEGGIPFIVMEFVRGMPLSRVMQLPARLLPAQKLAIFRQICRGIAYVHRHNIVHRDIKPANIMIRRDGKVKIMDFGIAKVLSAEGDLNLTLETVGTVGTINYMSPEQIRGGELDHRSDIFSLGVLLYELICDRKPFGGSGLSDKIHNIQHEAPAPIEAQRLAEFPTLEPIIRRCLEKDPQERYQNVGELDLAIKQIQVQNQDLFREADFFPPEESPDTSETLSAAPGEISGTRTFSGSAAGETTHLEVERPVAPDASRIRWMWAAMLVLLGLAGAGNLLWNRFETPSSLRTAPGMLAEMDYPDSASAADTATSPQEAPLPAPLPSSVGKVEIETPPPTESPDKAASNAAESAQPKLPAAPPPARRAVDSLSAALRGLQAGGAAEHLEKVAPNALAASEAFRRQADSLAGEHNWSDAAAKLRRAESLYRRALAEQTSLTRAKGLYSAGQYQECRMLLLPLLENPPYPGGNPVARDLASRASRAGQRFAAVLDSAENLVRENRLREAIRALEQLPESPRKAENTRQFRQRMLSLDRQGPEIRPETARDYNPQEPLTVSATIRDNYSLLRARLFYRREGQTEYRAMALSEGPEAQFRALLSPQQHEGRNIEYYILAEDSSGNVMRSDAGNGKPLQIRRREKHFIPRPP